MQNINFEFRDGGFHLTDFPNAEKVIMLDGAKAQKLADTALHRSDLIKAEAFLDQCTSEETQLAQDALWKMAIITFIKCFKTNNARTDSLSITEVLPGDLHGQEVFTYFENLRDKNIAHDDNPITQCLVGAVINKAGAPHKVEKVITLVLQGEVLKPENVSNLKKLIAAARAHVDRRYNELSAQLTTEMSQLEHSELIAMEPVQYAAPTAEDFAKNRKKLR
jgi:hypothetical protein